MRGKKIICMLLLVVMLLPMLSSCGMGTADALLIETFEAELMPDGSTRVTIQYLDDMEDPIEFIVPVGVSAEKGDPGNGIKSFKTVRDEDQGKQTITVEFTDEDMEPFTTEILDGENGATVVSTWRDDRVQEDGSVKSYLMMEFSNGETKEAEMVEGPPGVGIAQIVQSAEDQMTIYYSDHTEETPNFADIKLPRATGFTGKIATQYNVYDDTGTYLGLRIRFQLDEMDPETGEYNTYSDGIFIPYPADGLSISNVISEPITETNPETGVTRTGTKITFMREGEGPDGEETKLNDFTVFDGANIDKIEVAGETEEGDPILKITLTDGQEKKVAIPKAEAVGIKTVEIDTENQDPTKYALKITYTDNQTTTVSFPKNSAWHKGEGDPNASASKRNMGSIGDYYFDQESAVIYYKSKKDAWEMIVNLGAGSLNVRFNVSFKKGEKWSLYVDVQASSSSGLGSRFLGGRHFKIFAM